MMMFDVQTPTFTAIIQNNPSKMWMRSVAALKIPDSLELTT